MKLLSWLGGHLQDLETVKRQRGDDEEEESDDGETEDGDRELKTKTTRMNEIH